MVLTAGVAYAEVSISGDARMGVQKIEGNDTTVERRARVKFALSGETSNGLSFGASFRPQGALAAEDGNANNTGNVYISGAFGTLSVGSESSAAEYAVGDLAGVGFTGAGAGNENNFVNTANTSVVYTYSAGSVTAMASIGEVAGVGGKKLDTDTASLGVKYSAGDLTLGVGYERTAAADQVIAGVTYSMGDTTLKAVYGDRGDDSQMGASVAHTMGAVSLAGFYRTTETAGVDADYYGIGAAYDLGGGAAAKAGFASNNDVTTIEAGVTFSF